VVVIAPAQVPVSTHWLLRALIEKALQARDKQEVERLLASDVDPNDKHGTFGSPLNAAVFSEGNSEIMQLLLAVEANRCSGKPLFSFVAGQELDTVAILLPALMNAIGYNSPCLDQ